MNTIILSVSKNRLSGILSAGHPDISDVSGILSVVGIPPVPIPIPEEIQLLMYGQAIFFVKMFVNYYIKKYLFILKLFTCLLTASDNIILLLEYRFSFNLDSFKKFYLSISS